MVNRICDRSWDNFIKKIEEAIIELQKQAKKLAHPSQYPTPAVVSCPS